MRLNKTAAKKEIRTGRLVRVATSSSLRRCGSSRPFPQLLLEAAPLRRSSGTNVACAPLLVLRGSSSPSFPAAEATFGSDRVVQRHLAGLSCDNQALLHPFRGKDVQVSLSGWAARGFRRNHGAFSPFRFSMPPLRWPSFDSSFRGPRTTVGWSLLASLCPPAARNSFLRRFFLSANRRSESEPTSSGEPER